MKIVLIHPFHENSTDDRLDPPLGLLYIASTLRMTANNIEVSILDLSGTSEINIPYADFYGITSYISSLDITSRIFNICKKINPNSKVIIGGAHATVCPKDFAYADHTIQGFDDGALLSYVTKNACNSKDIYRFPSYDLIDISSYSRNINGKPSLPYSTSRGCPFSCAFCGLSLMHNISGLIMLSPEVVFSHVKRIKEEFGIEAINFQDDIFTLDKNRLFKILDLIEPLNIQFRCMGKAGYDTEEVYKRLSNAGCYQISWGIESGSQYILDRMNKRASVQDNYNVIDWAKKYGINTRAFFILGFPGETEKTLSETKNFILHSDPDQVFVSNMVPYPGTDVGINPEKYDIIKMYHDYDEYYQIGKNGTGPLLSFDTKWTTREEFRKLEINFRSWLKKKKMRGNLQNYEIELYKEK